MKIFAKIAKLLPDKTSEKLEFKSRQLMQMSLDTLKQEITTAPVLPYPDFRKPFLAAMDAFSTAFEAVFLQFDEN